MTGYSVNYYCLNAGQGDFNFVELVNPAGKVAFNLLSDCGNAGGGREFIDASIKYIVDRVGNHVDSPNEPDDGDQMSTDDQSIGVIDVIILTHSDKDHYNQLCDLIWQIQRRYFSLKVGKLYYSGSQQDYSETYIWELENNKRERVQIFDQPKTKKKAEIIGTVRF